MDAMKVIFNLAILTIAVEWIIAIVVWPEFFLVTIPIYILAGAAALCLTAIIIAVLGLLIMWPLVLLANAADRLLVVQRRAEAGASSKGGKHG